MDERNVTPGSGAGPANTPPFDRAVREPGMPEEQSSIARAPAPTEPGAATPGFGRTTPRGPGMKGQPSPGSGPFDRAAERLEEAGETLHQKAGRYADRVGEGVERPLHRTADSLEDAADNLRGMDLEDVREIIETRVREHPVQSLVLALALGWVAGKILR
jgi:ElaB/YqjD/DUF883 family membrane-anchored ribosome-binding protein